MTTDAIVRFAVGWGALVAWSTVAFAYLERQWPRHRDHPRGRRIALAAVLLAVNAAIGRLLADAVGSGGDLVVLGWLLGELFHYALHRAMHQVPLLWRFHRLHHEAGPLAWTTTWYVHPVDAALTAACFAGSALLVGAGVPSALWFVVGRRVWTIVLHANIAWPPSIIDGLVATPAFHARHHREDLPAANFADTLPVLDGLFGTFARVDARGSCAQDR